MHIIVELCRTDRCRRLQIKTTATKWWAPHKLSVRWVAEHKHQIIDKPLHSNSRLWQGLSLLRAKFWIRRSKCLQVLQRSMQIMLALRPTITFKRKEIYIQMPLRAMICRAKISTWSSVLVAAANNWLPHKILHRRQRTESQTQEEAPEIRVKATTLRQMVEIIKVSQVNKIWDSLLTSCNHQEECKKLRAMAEFKRMWLFERILQNLCYHLELWINNNNSLECPISRMLNKCLSPCSNSRMVPIRQLAWLG